jgi:hypothetical protein
VPNVEASNQDTMRSGGLKGIVDTVMRAEFRVLCPNQVFEDSTRLSEPGTELLNFYHFGSFHHIVRNDLKSVNTWHQI